MTASEKYPYVCDECGLEVRGVAELKPDGRGGMARDGVKLSCGCTTIPLAVNGGGVNLPEAWVLDTDNELRPFES